MPYHLEGKACTWEVVIGLEIHCQVTSKAKLFSPAAVQFGEEPNTQTDFLDAGFPGTLPVLNRFCVEQAVRTGLGLKAQINKRSQFSRKQYFYPDLPLGYQISQYDKPIVGNGALQIDLPEGSKTIRIERLHLECDAGKSIHDLHPRYTMIDLNRSGTALMEIVSFPDMSSPEEAAAYIRKMRTIVRYLGTCDGNMAEGSMRCDVNLSIRPKGEKTLRTRTETKNINSIRFIMQTIASEAQRQVALYEQGKEVVQQTRLFDPSTGQTRPMRSKETAKDYRYFPDPDLLDVLLDEAYIESLRKSLPELPDEKKDRFIKDYGLSEQDASVLVGEQDQADYFEAVAKGRDSKLAASWITTNLFGLLNQRSCSIVESPIKAEALGQLLDLITDGTISSRSAKEVFEIMAQSGKDPRTIVTEKNLKQISDTDSLEALMDALIASSPENLAQYKAGRIKVFAWFVGQIMQKTKGQANPQKVNELLKQKLDGAS